MYVTTGKALGICRLKTDSYFSLVWPLSSYLRVSYLSSNDLIGQGGLNEWTETQEREAIFLIPASSRVVTAPGFHKWSYLISRCLGKLFGRASEDVLEAWGQADSALWVTGAKSPFISFPCFRDTHHEAVIALHFSQNLWVRLLITAPAIAILLSFLYQSTV